MKLATNGTETTCIPVKQIRVNGGTQMRAGLNAETVGEYAEAMREYGGWGKFEPVEVYYDGATYWLADGFHRVAAAKEAEIEEAAATVYAGDQRKAILHAAGANADHGLRRTNADKRRAVEMMLRDNEWGLWSQADIARHCRVTPEYVSRLKKELSIDRSIDSSKIVTRGESTYQMETANIGRKIESESTPPQPNNIIASAHITPPDLARYGYEVYQLGEDGRCWWWKSSQGGQGAWETPDEAVARARANLDGMVRLWRADVRWMHAYLAADANGFFFQIALDHAEVEQLRLALRGIGLSKTRRERIEARIRKLEGEQPEIVAPNLEDLEQEADDLAAAGVPPAPAPQLPIDLAVMGFDYQPVGQGMWAIFRDSDDYQSFWHFDAADCIADVRAYLATRPATDPAESAVFDPEPVPTCRVCGCTDDNPCEGGCYWVEDEEMGDLCSACVVPLPEMLPRLKASGFYFVRPTPDTYAVRRDAELGEFESNAAELPGDAIEETLAYLEEMELVRVEGWLAAAPPEPDLHQCLAILEYAKKIAQRVRMLEPEMNLSVTNLMPVLSQMINRLEKRVKNGA
jgi:hypothetical protein